MSKDAIKQTALKLFAKHGYESTSMRAIANEVGLKAPSIYSHFLSKEDLYRQLSEEFLRDYTSIFHIAPNHSPSQENLDIGKILFFIFQDTLQFFLENSDKGMLWLRSQIFPPAMMENSPGRAMDTWNSFFQKNCSLIFKKGIAAGQIKDMDLQVLMDSYRSLIFGYMITRLSLNRPGEETALEEAWHIYWKGIAV